VTPPLRYFRLAVLAGFHNEPEKYAIRTDEFEGSVRALASDEHYFHVRFGFRACTNGGSAVVVYAPDLAKASDQVSRVWGGFEIFDSAELLHPADARFQKWFDRYFKGSWDIEDGPIAKLAQVTNELNAVTRCVVGTPLFSVLTFRALSLPTAENNHRYHDAHSELYKLLIDGLNKETIKALGDKFGIEIKVASEKTVKALMTLIPDGLVPVVRDPLDRVGTFRRQADHQRRPPAESFEAAQAFGNDVCAVNEGLMALRDYLAQRLNVDVASCVEHDAQVGFLPPIDPKRPAKPNYGIFNAFQFEGKTIVGVRAGYRIQEPGTAKTEALILEFSDGSKAGIEAATDVAQVLTETAQISAEDLSVTFTVTSVPAVLPFDRSH
jgi:hypothetical protein